MFLSPLLVEPVEPVLLAQGLVVRRLRETISLVSAPAFVLLAGEVIVIWLVPITPALWSVGLHWGLVPLWDGGLWLGWDFQDLGL